MTWKVATNGHKAGMRAGTLDRNGRYRRIEVSGGLYQEHRIIWTMVYGASPDCIDHINGKTDDNRLENLRAATKSQNQMNRHQINSNNKSGVRGIYWSAASEKWVAKITVNRKQLWVGCSNDLDELKKKREAAEKQHFGEFSAAHD